MIYDIIDHREIPTKKITMGYDGDAVELARKLTAGDRLVHSPTSDSNGGAEVRWFGTYSPAVIVKPARVTERANAGDIVRRTYYKAKKRAAEAEKRFDADRSEFNKYEFIEAVATLHGVFEVAEALGMVDGRGEFGKL